MRLPVPPVSLSTVSLLLLCLSLAGCYSMRESAGGGQTRFEPPRRIDATDIALPGGYRIEPVATGLSFPTGVAFDADGRPHVIEAGYSYGEVWRTPRLLRVGNDGSLVEIAAGGGNGPWNGIAFADGGFYVAEGGVRDGGRILRITPAGEISVLVDGLPSFGDHHTNGPAVGPDGALYFSIGTATNSGVVGVDNAAFGWLDRRPQFHDIPCRDVQLAGVNFETTDPLTGQERVSTGAYSAFGQPTEEGMTVPGRVPCSGAVLRVALAGGEPGLVAWGLRNPYGLAFSSTGTLYVTENGYDARGSRPVWGAPDVLWRIDPGAWYGWPDYIAGEPVEDERYAPPGGEAPRALLTGYPGVPREPVAKFAVHSSSNGLDFSWSDTFGYVDQAFVAQFGDQAPNTGKVLAPVGFKVVRVDMLTGVVRDFAVNRGATNGPASYVGGGGLERPVAVRFDPGGEALYVVDFGVLLETGGATVPQPETGVLWRITRTLP